MHLPIPWKQALCVLIVCHKHRIKQVYFNHQEGAFTSMSISKELPRPELSALSGCWELTEKEPSRRDFCSFNSCCSSRLRMKLQMHIKMSNEQGWNILLQYFQLKQNAWGWPEICFLFLFSCHFPVARISGDFGGADGIGQASMLGDIFFFHTAWLLIWNVYSEVL